MFVDCENNTFILSTNHGFAQLALGAFSSYDTAPAPVSKGLPLLIMSYNIPLTNNTFSNKCPLLVHYEPTNNIVPATCNNIVAGVYIARPPVTNLTNFAGINLAGAAAARPLQKCRLYYSQIQMEPQRAVIQQCQ